MSLLSDHTSSTGTGPNYVRRLDDLVTRCTSTPYTPPIAQGRKAAPASMNMPWELCHSDMNLAEERTRPAVKRIGPRRGAAGSASRAISVMTSPPGTTTAPRSSVRAT
jgi:hypothetical protein